MVPLVAEKIAIIEQLCRENDVARLWLFGSAARDGSRFDNHSDLDFIVEFRRGRDELKGFDDPFWKLYIAFEELFGRTIQMVEPHEIRRQALREAILRQRELLYDGTRAVAAS